jgi:hypothetical protein
LFFARASATIEPVFAPNDAGLGRRRKACSTGRKAPGAAPGKNMTRLSILRLFALAWALFVLAWYVRWAFERRLL